MPASDPVETLKRWCDHGADYRVLHLSERSAIVQLCTCSGEPVERLESGDPRLIDYLQARSSAPSVPEWPD